MVTYQTELYYRKATLLSSRGAITGLLSQRVGFPFNEAELSPSLRKKVGDLADMQAQIEFRRSTVVQRQNDIARLKSQKGKNTGWVVILAAVGVALAIVIIGLFFLVGAFLLYRQRRKIDEKIRNIDAEMMKFSAEAMSIESSLNSSLNTVAQEIGAELSAVHEQKSRTVGVATGPSVQFVKETVREVVMVPCAFCGGLMLQTSLRCSNCGAQKKH